MPDPDRHLPDPGHECTTCHTCGSTIDGEECRECIRREREWEQYRCDDDDDEPDDAREPI